MLFTDLSGGCKFHGMHATMDDIARECGLSKKTVSRVFAGSSSVKKSTRDRVLEAAKRLRYEVNFLARNFSSNRSGFIGIAAPMDAVIGGSYFAEVMRGFRCAIPDDLGYVFALFDTNSDSFSDGEKLAKLYRQRRVDGLLAVAMHTRDRFVDSLGQIGVPIVVVGEKPSSPNICSTYCNDAHGIQLLCAHLHACGHRRIAFIEGPPEYASSNLRKQAFMKFARKQGLETPLRYARGTYSLHSGRVAATVLLQSTPRPTAIVTSNDTLAFGAIEGIRSLNLRIPEDVSVAGFDDDPMAAECSPSLTTVHQPVFEMAELSARKLVQALRNRTLPAGNEILNPHLVIRESTGKPHPHGRIGSKTR